MWYKEWITVRLKFGLWLMVYGLLAVAYIFLWSDYRPGGFWNDPIAFVRANPDTANYLWINGRQASLSYLVTLVNDPTFLQLSPQAPYYAWLGILLLVTPFAAILGGMDLVSEEVDKGTLSFLLTRPISRTAIYSSKVLVNAVALVGAITLPSAFVLIYDQLQHRTISIPEGLGLTALILLIGLAVLCLGGLVSIFTRSVLQTLSLTIFIGLVLFLAFAYGSSNLSHAWYNYNSWLNSNLFLTLAAPVLLAITLGLFLAGRTAFTRKEF